jgi:hypothetical protein
VNDDSGDASKEANGMSQGTLVSLSASSNSVLFSNPRVFFISLTRRIQ